MASICSIHHCSKVWLGGAPAHPDNLYCPACDIQAELTKAQAEIARMHPVVDMAIEAKNQGLLPMYLDIAVGDYEAGEKQ
jgi:hypothetical protein